jgi:CheY-like chemotaxis protein
MPGMDGLETSRIIFEEKKKKPTIIMVTAFGKEDIAEKASKIGINSFLVKPISHSVLFDTIMKVFEKEERTINVEKRKSKQSKELMNNLLGTSILLVEDNEINQQVAYELLHEVGIEVEIAENGVVAIEKLKSSGIPSKYHLILMDIQMPVMDGYTATIEIRKIKEFDSIPIVAMTADAMSGIKEKCISCGMQDFITKPIKPEELFNTATKYIVPKDAKTGLKLVETEKHFTGDDIIIPDFTLIDVNDGLERLGGMKKLYLNILLKFYETNLNSIEELKSAIRENDKERAVRIAHSIKGASGNIGAKKLYEEASKIEIILKENIEIKDEELLNFSKLLADTIKEIGTAVLK